jgi:hypothetical protein
MFYPDIRKHCSPSALEAWIHNRSYFVRSYFEGEKSPETAAMAGGKKIHMLIEAGLIQAQNVYDLHEQEIRIPIGEGIEFMGIPDSREAKAKKGEIHFVDYKTGKANSWAEKLPSDVKMRATAWLVWKAAGEPAKVHGHIEFIQTTWDAAAKEVVPIEDAKSETISITYTAGELEEFGKAILKAVQEVNAFYEKWKEKTDVFINREDVARYAELKTQIAKLEKDVEEVADRVFQQMEFGGISSLPTDLGTVYITERKTYEYPLELDFKVGKKKYTIEEAAEVDAAAKAAKKNYEMIAEPKETKRSIGFRQAK